MEISEYLTDLGVKVYNVDVLIFTILKGETIWRVQDSLKRD